MKILDRILEYRRTPYIIAGVIFFCSLGVLSCFKSAEAQLTMLNHAASLSRTMAKSSDDLTNYARFFVTTKNEQWRTEFNNVLKIRNGEMADEKGVTKSFKVRVKEVPFLQTELDQLLKAEQLSNNLARLEEIVDTTNQFYIMVINRLQAEYLFYMTAAWTLIIVINVSLLLLVMIINHKDAVKPQRVTVKKALPKPRAKKTTQ